jgi:hypothetical protein
MNAEQLIILTFQQPALSEAKGSNVSSFPRSILPAFTNLSLGERRKPIFHSLLTKL